MDKEQYEKHSFVVYSTSEIAMEHGNDNVLPHGNAKETPLPYIRTSKTILEKESQLLQSVDSRPSMVYDDLVKTFDPFTISSQSLEPLNVKQLQKRVITLFQ